MPQLDLREPTLDNGQQFLPDAIATEAVGKELAAIVKAPIVIFLVGELGAGKTTLVRGFLGGLGYEGSVKSPTFTLVEPYQFEDYGVYHFDLYRLDVPEELESIGIRDYFTADAIVLVEWPERGVGFLPKADLILELSVAPEGEGRILKLTKAEQST